VEQQLPITISRELERIDLKLKSEAQPQRRAKLQLRKAQLCLAAPGEQGQEQGRELLWASWRSCPGLADTHVLLSRLLERDGNFAERALIDAETAMQSDSPTIKAELTASALDQRLTLDTAAIDDEQLAKVDVAIKLLVSDARCSRALAQYSPRRARALLTRLAEGEQAELGLQLAKVLVKERHDAASFDDALRLARLCEQLKRPDEAFDAYRTALSLRPAAAEALDPARSHLMRRRRYEALAELLAVSAPAAPTPALGARLWRELAQLSEEHLNDLARALQAWWRAWELDNTGQEPGELKRLYSKEERWTRYLDVLRQEMLRTPTADERLDVLRELSVFQQTVLNDELGAADSCEQILQLAPFDHAARKRLIGLFENRLTRAIESADRYDIERAFEQCVRSHARHAHDCETPTCREESVRRLVDLYLARKDFAKAFHQLRRLMVNDSENHALLLRLWEQSQSEKHALYAHREELSRVLAAALQRVGKDEDPERAQKAQKLAQAAGPAVRAMLGVALESANKEDETASESSADKADIAHAKTIVRTLDYRAVQADQNMNRLARRAAETQGRDPRRAVRMLIHAAKMGAHHDATARSARHFVMTARDICPSNAQPEIFLVESSLHELGMLEELADQLNRRAEKEISQTRKLQALHALARVLQDDLAKPDRAAKVLLQIEQLNPGDREVLSRARSLRADLANLSDRQLLLDLLEGVLMAASGSGSAHVELLRELAEVSDEVGNGAKALSYYAQLLRRQPNDETALDYIRKHIKEHSAQRSVIAELTRAAEAIDDPSIKRELTRQLATIAEQELADLDFAISNWRQLMLLSPDDPEPRQELNRLLRSSERWHDLEALLLSEISRCTEPARKVPLYCELARLALDSLSNPRAAASHLRNAMQLAPANTEVLNELANVYQSLGQWRALAAVLHQQSESLDDKQQQAEVLARAADVTLSELGRDEEALAICRRVFELHPGQQKAARIMGQIYMRRGQWSQLASVLRDQIGAEQDPKRLATLHVELANLLLNKLDSGDAAAQHFESALDLDPEQRDVLPRLRDLYARMERWDLLATLIERLAEREGSDAQLRADAFCEIGQLRLEREGNQGAAREAFEQALRLVPTHRQAISDLRHLLADTGDWREAVDLARRELTLLQDDDERATLLIEIASALRDHLNRPAAAEEALLEALDADPQNTSAMAALGTLAFDREDWNRAVDLFEKLTDNLVDSPRLHLYYHRLAQASEQLGDEERAFAAYVKAFGREPMFLPTLERLVELCYERNQWENTLRIAEAIIGRYADRKSEQELADLYVTLGKCELHLAQLTAATHRLRPMIVSHGGQLKSGDEGLRDVAASWAATPVDPQLLEDLDYKVLTRVIKATDQALARIPDHPGALQLLAALTMCRGDWDRSLRYLERAAESEKTPAPLKAKLLAAAGDIATHRLLSNRRGVDYYQRALDHAPSSPRLSRRLADLRDRTGGETHNQSHPQNQPHSQRQPSSAVRKDRAYDQESTFEEMATIRNTGQSRSIPAARTTLRRREVGRSARRSEDLAKTPPPIPEDDE
jgi:tetratricopeptide (TPR) repeat protein